MSALGVSLDATHYAYFEWEHDIYRLMIDGKPSEYTVDGVEWRIRPLFSPDSQHYAYYAQKGEKYVVVRDGVESEPYDGLSCIPAYSPDSKHFAYVARRRDKYVIVLDGKEIGNYSGAVGGSRLTFGQDAALTAFMNHGDEIFRVEVPVGRNPE